MEATPSPPGREQKGLLSLTLGGSQDSKLSEQWPPATGPGAVTETEAERVGGSW